MENASAETLSDFQVQSRFERICDRAAAITLLPSILLLGLIAGNIWLGSLQ